MPGKPLLEIAGRPMVVHVVERALSAPNVTRAIVATDDERIAAAVTAAGFEAAMTRSDHASGSDRLAELSERLENVDVIVNLQGDEPMISPHTIARAVNELIADDSIGIATAAERITDPEDVTNPNVVKVVTDSKGNALYFSRSPIPFPRDAVARHGTVLDALRREPHLLQSFRKHTGLYVYRRELLLEYAKWPQTELERDEGLEQLRALEHGVKIRVIEAESPSIGIDTAEDLERVRRIMEGADEGR